MSTLKLLVSHSLGARVLSCVGLVVGMVASPLSPAQAAQVNENITVRSCPDGTAVEVLATHTGTPLIVTRLPGPGESWEIDLTGSGHQVPGATWPNGFFDAAWDDPFPGHPGTAHNLSIDTNLKQTLETHAATAVGDNIGTYPGGFGNGVSYYAGNDFNGNQVFPRITSVELAETDPLCVDPIEQLELKMDVMETKLDDLSLDEILQILQSLKAQLEGAVVERAALEAKLDASELERAALEAKLDQQQTQLQEIIRLLNTPQGRRPDWNE